MKNKKDKKDKNKEDAQGFAFKQFSPEEDRIYEEAVNAYRDAIAAGKTLREAYDGHPVADPELRALVQADFLKIQIAERHFAKREPLDALAAALGVPLDLVRGTLARMLEEVGVSTAEQFARETGGAAPATDD